MEPGTRFDRYGLPSGSYAASAGTPFAMRSLPPGYETLPVHTYEVLRPLGALRGPAAPAFGQIGGGTQYKFETSINVLVEQGYIREVPQ